MMYSGTVATLFNTCRITKLRHTDPHTEWNFTNTEKPKFPADPSEGEVKDFEVVLCLYLSGESFYAHSIKPQRENLS